MPVIFVGHGSPMNAMKEIAKRIPKPEVIIRYLLIGLPKVQKL